MLCLRATFSCFCLVVCAAACHRVDPKPLAKALPIQPPTFEGAKAISFSYPYASSLQNAQVFVPRKRFSAFGRHPIEYCRHTVEPLRGPPFALVVSPDARHAFFVYDAGGDIIDANGCAHQGGGHDPVALSEGVFFGGEGYGWDLEHRIDQNNFKTAAVARRIEGDRYTAVANMLSFIPDRPVPPPAVVAQGGHRAQRYLGDGIEWSRTMNGCKAVAAIGGDFSVVVALDNHMLQIYAPIADDKGQARLVAERNIGARATWLSLANRTILAVSSDGSGTRLQAFTADAKPVYSLSVPFEVLQPPVAGIDGRAYLVGKGIAAIDDGKVAWQHASDQPLYASSFEDGSLAIATGKRLDLVKTDGVVDQSFESEEPLVTLPAIAGDGSVWCASSTAIYIAR